ncbi:cGMP-dependent protein kinase 1 [Episyrphus balteatus]|uniref:cGMP-dependent protein kinase 1 n=1 Tax=Episyrphus balteatus TaxID=286459 RepID=UPI0024850852|nr:cGMP-dependent protein kinase 1 [Episyrphus balteatus]
MACFPRILKKKDGFYPQSQMNFLNETLAKDVKSEKYTRHEEPSLVYENGTTTTTTTLQKETNDVDDDNKLSSNAIRDSGVQIEDTFEAKDIAVDASSRAAGGVMFARPKLSNKKPINIEVFQKDESTRNLIRTAIERNDFLNNYMDKDRKEMVIDAMQAATYDQGSYIIRQNEEGSEIFVSEEGYYDVIKSGSIIGTIGPGTVFGELAILYSAKRFASIKTATRAKVWKIDRLKFRNIMLVSGYKEKEEYLQFLKSSPILKDLSQDVLVKLVDLLKRRFYPGNTCIVREGEVGNEFFIIRGGTVTIKKFQEDGTEKVVAHRKRGDYFGEHAILNADVRQASVYADPPVTECLKLDRETVISYLGTIPQLREKPDIAPTQRFSIARHSVFNQKYGAIQLSDLRRIATLGCGAFGRVDLVQHKTDERTFALKILRKIDVIKQDQIEHVYSEKQVMMMCRGSPFIVELYKTFRNDKYVYFLIEACLGGDVWTIMSKRKYFDEKTARFISGCVVEAFEYLHSRNIIYRDLKPENLMLTTDGYCKLVDFGFAKRVLECHKTNTFAGTPEYVAPEIILDRGHDKSVDYWALGILIFELLVGKSPFRGQNQIKIYQQILGGIDVIQMPSRIPKTAQGLIKQLCKQMPAERLGYQRKGILDIKRHGWFDGFDWKRLKAKTLPSPIQRPINSNMDLQYFEPCSADNDEPPDENSGWDVDF